MVAHLVFRVFSSLCFNLVVLVYRLVPPSSIEVRGDIDLGDIISGIVDLSDLDLEPVVVVVDRVLGMAI